MNILLYVAVVLIWGTTWIGIAVQSHYATPVVAIFMALCYFSLITLGCFTIFRKITANCFKRSFVLYAARTLCFGLNFICFIPPLNM